MFKRVIYTCVCVCSSPKRNELDVRKTGNVAVGRRLAAAIYKSIAAAAISELRT